MNNKKPKLTTKGKENYTDFILKFCEERFYVSAIHMTNLYYDELNSKIGIDPMDKESLKRSLSINASRVLKKGREYGFLEPYNRKTYWINHKKLKAFLKETK